MTEKLNIPLCKGAIFGRMPDSLFRMLPESQCRRCGAYTEEAIMVEPNISMICCRDCKDNFETHQKLIDLVHSVRNQR